MARPSIDIADETFVVADRHRLADYFSAPSVWRAWWPRLHMTMAEDRGIEGVRWSVSGDVLGTAEIWLEDWGDGVIVHWFLRGEPAPGTSRRQCVRFDRNLNVAYKARVHELKDRVERGRPAGVPRAETIGRLDTSTSGPVNR